MWNWHGLGDDFVDSRFSDETGKNPFEVSEFEYVHFLPDGTLFERLFEILSILFENTGKSTLTVLVTMKSLIFRYFYFNFQAWNLLPKH